MKTLASAIEAQLSKQQCSADKVVKSNVLILTSPFKAHQPARPCKCEVLKQGVPAGWPNIVFLALQSLLQTAPQHRHLTLLGLTRALHTEDTIPHLVRPDDEPQSSRNMYSQYRKDMQIRCHGHKEAFSFVSFSTFNARFSRSPTPVSPRTLLFTPFVMSLMV
jgi:hypothetical protein